MANGKFKLVGRKNIPGHDTDIEVDIGAENEKDYEVVTKPVPDPTPYKGKTIIWFNAFGVKVKANGRDADITYTVTLQNCPLDRRCTPCITTPPTNCPCKTQAMATSIHAEYWRPPCRMDNYRSNFILPPRSPSATGHSVHI